MILPATRLLLVVFGGLTLLAFVVLFVLADATERYFAWTIKPPATAAFLGAAYAAGCALVRARPAHRTWAALRIPFLTILVFTVATLVATLLHLDRFHFNSDLPIARIAAYLWLAIYVVVPLAMMVVLVIQERRPAERPDRVAIPVVLRVDPGCPGRSDVRGGCGTVPGAGTARPLWPWMLTPLTARVVAAWLLAFGVGVILAAVDGDLAPARHRGVGVRAARGAGDRGDHPVSRNRELVGAGDLGLPRHGGVDPCHVGVRAAPAASQVSTGTPGARTAHCRTVVA